MPKAVLFCTPAICEPWPLHPSVPPSSKENTAFELVIPVGAGLGVLVPFVVGVACTGPDAMGVDSAGG